MVRSPARAEVAAPRRIGAHVRPSWALVAVFAAALALRLLALPARGFPSDVDEIVGWARRLAAVGPWGFYAAGHSANYPAVLYVLWPLGAWLDGDALRVAIKGLSIPFDLAIGALLYALVRRVANEAAALVAAGLYLLDPAVLVAGSYWGQIDAVGTLPYLGALALAARRRHAAAGAVAMLAALVKPQFGLVALPVAAVAIADAVRARSIGPAARAAVAAAGAFAVVALPLRFSPGDYVALVRDATAPWPYTSLYAFNPWGLLFGFLRPDDAVFGIGAALLALGVVASLVPLARRRDLAALLAVGAFLTFAFYFLPTRVHERYLFPALAVLAPLAALRPRVLAPYLALAGCFTLALLYMLWSNAAATGFVVPDAIGATLFSWPGVWAIGLVLMAAAALLVRRLVAGEARLDPVPDAAPALVTAPRTLDDRAVGIVLGAIAIALYLGATVGQTTVYDYFGRLAVAFTHGEYWLDGAPAHLNELVRGVGGHEYSVVPPLPALLIVPLLPFASPAAAQVFVSALLGGASAIPLFHAQRALGVPRPLAVWTTLLSTFGTTLWVTAVDGRSWFAADAVTFFFACLAVWAAAARRSLLVVGAALGAAALTRTPLALAAPGLLLLRLRDEPRGGLARSLALFALGAAPFALVEVAYDLARWGQPFDVGYALLSADDPFYSRGLFSLTYLPRHLYAILFEPPGFVDGDPLFLRARSVGMSLVASTPAILWLARAAVVGRGFRPSLALALACLAIAPDLVFGTVGFEQYGYRRSLDAQAFLVPLLAVGAGWTAAGWRPSGTALFRAAVALSIALTLYFLVTIRAFGFA